VTEVVSRLLGGGSGRRMPPGAPFSVS